MEGHKESGAAVALLELGRASTKPRKAKEVQMELLEGPRGLYPASLEPWLQEHKLLEFAESLTWRSSEMSDELIDSWCEDDNTFYLEEGDDDLHVDADTLARIMKLPQGKITLEHNHNTDQVPKHLLAERCSYNLRHGIALRSFRKEHHKALKFLSLALELKHEQDALNVTIRTARVYDALRRGTDVDLGPELHYWFRMRLAAAKKLARKGEKDNSGLCYPLHAVWNEIVKRRKTKADDTGAPRNRQQAEAQQAGENPREEAGADGEVTESEDEVMETGNNETGNNTERQQAPDTKVGSKNQAAAAARECERQDAAAAAAARECERQDAGAPAPAPARAQECERQDAGAAAAAATSKDLDAGAAAAAAAGARECERRSKDQDAGAAACGCKRVNSSNGDDNRTSKRWRPEQEEDERIRRILLDCIRETAMQAVTGNNGKLVQEIVAAVNKSNVLGVNREGFETMSSKIDKVVSTVMDVKNQTGNVESYMRDEEMDMKIKLAKMETYQVRFENAQQQLGEKEKEIEKLNEQIKQLQGQVALQKTYAGRRISGLVTLSRAMETMTALERKLQTL